VINRKRRKPRTLWLDLVEEKGAIEPELAKDALKLILKLKKGKGLQSLSEQESRLAEYLLVSVIGGPVRPDERRAFIRNGWIAQECAYYKSLGDPAARTKTAKNWGVSPRTVSRAMRLFPGRYDNPKRERNEELKNFFEAARGAYGGPLAKSRYTSGRQRLGHEIH
jgi:hypothetical protein